MSPRSGSGSAPGSGNRRLLVAAAAGSFLAGVNIATIQVALPTISRHFASSPSAASWTLLSYLVVFTVMVLVLGRVADMQGHGRTYLVGVGLLTLASLLCGLAPNVETLIAMRCLQAVGAAAASCTIAALVAEAVPPQRLASSLSVNFAVGSLGQVLGPGLGGLLASTFGWQSVFWFNVPIGLATLALAWSATRREGAPGGRPAHGGRERFDVLGALLAACGLGGLVVGVNEVGLLGWSHPVVLGCLGMSLVAIVLFCLVESRSSHPLVDLALFAHPVRGPAYLSLLLLGGSFYGILAITSLFLQAGGLSAGETGVRVLTLALAMTISMPIAGTLAARFPSRILATAGTAVLTLSLLGFALTVGHPGLIPLWLAGVGAGVGVFQASNTNDIMGSASPSQRALANGARQATQNTGYTMSSALSLAIVAAGLTEVGRRAVYAGSLHELGADQIALFTGSFHTALLVLAGIGLLATLASAIRPQAGDQPLEPI